MDGFDVVIGDGAMLGRTLGLWVEGQKVGLVVECGIGALEGL